MLRIKEVGFCFVEKSRTARGFLFVRGGRILKNETIEDAFKKVTFLEKYKFESDFSLTLWKLE